MWRTPLGERVLRGAEWALFRQGLSSLWDWVEDGVDGEDDLFDVGVKAFDRLQKNQKLSLLVEVGRALKDEATPCPELTSCVEATVAVVFRLVLREIRMEIDLESNDVDDDPQRWRRLVRDAVDATSDGDDEEGDDREGSWAITLESTDLEAWSECVDHLTERVLWDEDFDQEDDFVDDSPDEGRALMKRLLIAEDYFVAVAPDPRDDELAELRVALMEICERR